MNKTEFQSDWGRVPFVNGHMIGQVSLAAYSRALLRVEDPKEVDPRILWKDPYEFEATVQIVSTSPPIILQSLEEGIRYQTKVSEIQRIVDQVGITKGGFVTGKWVLKKDNRSSPWYLSLKREDGDDGR